MSDVTRRALLQGVGATAAVTAAGVLAPAAASAAQRRDPSHDDHPTASTTSLVAHVSDATSGEITVLAGDREVVVHDRALAQRLARLAD